MADAAATGWVLAENQIGHPKIGGDAVEAGTTRSPKVGQIVRGWHEDYGVGEFIWLKGVSSTAVGSWVTYNMDDGTSTLLAADAVGPVAVAMTANTSSDDGAWYQIQGKAVGKALSGYVDNADVYATSTAGSVDDAVVAGDRVKRAKGASAVGTPSSGLAEFEIDRPFADDGKAA